MGKLKAPAAKPVDVGGQESEEAGGFRGDGTNAKSAN